MAWEGSAEVENTFTMRRRLVASIQTQSVKVPPVSMATRRGWERRGMVNSEDQGNICRRCSLRSLDSRGGCPHMCRGDSAYHFVVKAKVSSVFCSTSCALALPVAGLALELRFTESTWRLPAMRWRRGSMLNNAPMLAGSSWTQTISPDSPWRGNLGGGSFF